MSKIGIVAIGRNEGPRLRRCLEAVAGRGMTVVYVDSGSTDGSIELARGMGVDVVELDPSAPFSAARARNQGFERLSALDPGAAFVQFVDGDCELAEGWLERAARALEEHPDAAVVCGRRRERFPERSVFNRLADLEWEIPAGAVGACGGDAMMRAEAFREAGGYNPAIIAGEEPELCVRLRRAGWKVLCIDAEMTRHDIAMTRLGQWWRRTVRAGHAYAEGAALHGRPPERHFVREARSALLWGLLFPMLALALAWPTRGISLGLLLAGYLLLFRRAYRYYATRRGWPASDARLYAAWVVLAKFPEVVGLLRYHAGRAFGRPQRVIDYKGTKLAEPAGV